MGDFLLLRGVVGSNLDNLVLSSRRDIAGVVTRMIDRPLLVCEVHGIRADEIHDILRVRCANKNAVVCAEVCLKPGKDAEIQVISGFVEETSLDEEQASARYTYELFSGYDVVSPRTNVDNNVGRDLDVALCFRL